jgi:hypothetical protein
LWPRNLNQYRLTCSKSNKQQLTRLIQKDAWVGSEFEDTTPPPPYCEYPGIDDQPGAGFNLVCNCVFNTIRSQRSLERKSEPKSRKSRTSSVKKLIGPMTKMFKSSSKQASYSPMEQETAQWRPAMQTGSCRTDSQGQVDVEYHELPAERTVSELPDNNYLNELDAERPIGELEGSELEGQTPHSSQPMARPPITNQEWNHSNPVSPMSYTSDHMQCPTRAIADFMLDPQVRSPVSPQASVSLSRFPSNQQVLTTPGPSMTQLRASRPVGLGFEHESFELDAGLYTYHETRSSQPDIFTKKNFPSWCLLPGRHHSISSRKEIRSNVVPMPDHGPAQLGYQRGYFEDCRRAEQVTEQGESSEKHLNDDGELPVRWESQDIQEPLIGMVESIIYQLQPQGAKVRRMLEEGAIKVTRKWNDILRQRWNRRGDLSKKDLPFFLGGWISKVEASTNTILESVRSTVMLETDRYSPCPNALDRMNKDIGLPYRQLDLVGRADRAGSDDLTREHGGVFAVPMVRSNHFSVSRTDSNSRSSWAEPGLGSPPPMHRYVVIRA